MKKPWMLLLAGCSLAVGCLGTAAAANALRGAADISYPGAVRLETELVDPALLEIGALSHQAIYQSADDRVVVTRWYAERLQVAPASNRVLTGGDCSQVSQSELLIWIGHSVVVNLCDTRPGTRIVVNEKLQFWP